MKIRLRMLVVMAAAATVVASAGRLFADDTSAVPGGTVDDRINRLEQEIQELRHQRELDQQQAQQHAKQQADQAAQKAKTTPVVAAGPDGFTLKSADNNFVLRLHGYVQADGQIGRAHV